MKQTVKAYDLDGTLIDSEEINRIFHLRLVKDIPKDVWFKKYTGLDEHKILKDLRPEFTDEYITKWMNIYQEYFKTQISNIKKNNNLVEQIKKDKSCIIVSSRGWTMANLICKELGIVEYVKDFFTGPGKLDNIKKAANKYNIVEVYDDVEKYLSIWKEVCPKAKIICVRNNPIQLVKWENIIDF